MELLKTAGHTLISNGFVRSMKRKALSFAIPVAVINLAENLSERLPPQTGRKLEVYLKKPNL